MFLGLHKEAAKETHTKNRKEIEEKVWKRLRQEIEKKMMESGLF